MLFGIEALIQSFINASKLDVSLIRISDAKPDSFVMTFLARVTQTGPFNATFSSTTVDLVGPAGTFGRLILPEMNITSKGADIKIENQKIDILDMAAFLAFTEAQQCNEKSTLVITNGHPTIKVLGFKYQINFNKTTELPGMNGPQTEFLKGKGDLITAKIHNPSPLELDLGECFFECRNASGQTLAKISGEIMIPRGESVHEVTMTVVPPPDMKAGDISKIFMVGLDVKQDSWLKEGIKHYHVPVPVTKELEDLIRTREAEIQAQMAKAS